MARWSVCHYARPHPSFLRAQHVSYNAAQAMGEILEGACSLSWPRPNDHPVWQRDSWDTQLRRHESYGSKWEYVINNPVRAGLVKEANKWPFQGELNVLPW